MQQVQDIAVEVVEEYRRIARLLHDLGQERNALLPQAAAGGIEILDGKRHVADSRVVHPGHASGGLCRLDDLDHRPVRRFNEHGAAVVRSVVDGEAQVFDVPLGQPLRVGRGDSGMLNAYDHHPRL